MTKHYTYVASDFSRTAEEIRLKPDPTYEAEAWRVAPYLPSVAHG
jgi:hypothetical protein